MRKCLLCDSGRMRPTRLQCDCGRVKIDGEVEIPPLGRLEGEQRRIAEALVICGGNLSEVGKRLEVSQPTLRKRITATREALRAVLASDAERVQAILDAIEAGRLEAEAGLRQIEDIHGRP